MDAEAVFKAMADVTRRRVLQLVARGELSVSEIVDCLGQPQSTVSRHLKVLREAGLIHDRREGTTVLYAAPPPPSAAGNGAERRLQGEVVRWMDQEELPKVLRDRLTRTLNRRREGSEEFFSRVANRWDQMRVEAFGDRFHLEAMTALLPNEWVAADIGTGTGFLLPMLGRCFRKVIAVDPVPEMLAAAEARCAANGLRNVMFRQGDLSRLPIPSGKVDLACAMLVLHHVESPTDALAELSRILKPGGRLLIVEMKTHNLAAFQERMHDRWPGFEPSRLMRDVAAAGFEDVAPRGLEASAKGVEESPEMFVIAARRGSRNASLSRNRLQRT